MYNNGAYTSIKIIVDIQKNKDELYLLISKLDKLSLLQ